MKSCPDTEQKQKQILRSLHPSDEDASQFAGRLPQACYAQDDTAGCWGINYEGIRVAVTRQNKQLRVPPLAPTTPSTRTCRWGPRLRSVGMTELI